MKIKDVEKWSMNEVIDNINKLAKIKKSRNLTDKENEFREALKTRYLFLFRENFKNQLKNTKIFDEKGNDITPLKIRKGQKNDN